MQGNYILPSRPPTPSRWSHWPWRNTDWTLKPSGSMVASSLALILETTHWTVVGPWRVWLLLSLFFSLPPTPSFLHWKIANSVRFSTQVSLGGMYCVKAPQTCWFFIPFCFLFLPWILFIYSVILYPHSPATAAEPSCWAVLTWQRDITWLPGTLGHIHRQLYTRGDLHAHTHTNTHAHLPEEIIIHYPFKGKKYIYITAMARFV